MKKLINHQMTKCIIAILLLNKLINRFDIKSEKFLYYGLMIILSLMFGIAIKKGLVTKKFWKALVLFYFMTIITTILAYFLTVITKFDITKFDRISQLVSYYITLIILAVISYFIADKFFKNGSLSSVGEEKVQ